MIVLGYATTDNNDDNDQYRLPTKSSLRPSSSDPRRSRHAARSDACRHLTTACTTHATDPVHSGRPTTQCRTDSDAGPRLCLRRTSNRSLSCCSHRWYVIVSLLPLLIIKYHPIFCTFSNPPRLSEEHVTYQFRSVFVTRYRFIFYRFVLPTAANPNDMWREAKAPNGRIYYYKKSTRETTWVKPAMYIPLGGTAPISSTGASANASATATSTAVQPVNSMSYAHFLAICGRKNEKGEAIADTCVRVCLPTEKSKSWEKTEGRKKPKTRTQSKSSLFYNLN